MKQYAPRRSRLLVLIVVSSLLLSACGIKLIATDQQQVDSEPAEPEERLQMTTVLIDLSDDRLGTPSEVRAHMALHEQIAVVLNRDGTGDVQYVNVGGGHFMISIAGASAERIWDSIRPLVSNPPLPAGSEVVLYMNGDHKRYPF